MTIPMAELEIDDVAFLTGDSNGNEKQSCRGMCGSKSNKSHNLLNWRKMNALTVGFCSLIVIITIALIIAFVYPLHDRCFSTTKNLTSEGSHELTIIPQRLVSTNGELFPWTDIRLPQFIVPFRYELSMRPNMTTFYNKGSVDILLKVTEKTDFLVIHIKKLNITDILMTAGNGANISIIKHLECLTHEQLFIKFENELISNHINYSLRINFERQLEEQLEGFYVSSYLDSSTGQKRYLLTTHFEPTSARSAFPCFDEPSMKASFSMKFIHEHHFEAYFNSEKVNKLKVEEGLMLTIFEETVPMSTYLVAFVLCDFNSISAKTKEGVDIRALVPGDVSQAEFALNSATAILSYFQEFFNVTYPLSKLDLVAVPDFGAGAMENWGLITFRTTMFLYNVNESSSETQEQVAIVVAHELAHQWFGNLVTMNWWNDLWLNEGFASYVENLGVNHIYPEWKMLDQFVISTTQQALALDSLQSSHPIMANVKNPSEIEAIFDAISYKKGASLIRMLENFLSINHLRLGLSKYLNKYKFKTAKTQDLWHCFSEMSKSQSINVSAIMDTWVMQKGYPVISVKWDANGIVLSQRRFLSSPPDSDTTEQSDISPFGYKWIIPITLMTSKDPHSNQLIWFNTTDLSIPLDKSNKWFKMNVNQSGFYRVNYEPSIWSALTENLITSKYNQHMLSPTDRANLIDDAFALMKRGLLRIDLAMNLTLYLENGERDYVPWETAIFHFGVLDTLMLQNPLLQKYVCKLIEPLITIWGWKDHSFDLMLVRKLRALLLRAAVAYGDKQSIQVAIRYFQSWMNNNTKIPANLREVVYNTGIQFGGSREWNFCWDKYLKSSVPSEKKLLLGALGSTRNAWLLSQYLNYSLDKTKIKTQDTVHVITTVSRNPIGKEMVWKFIRENWDKIIGLFGQGSFSMDSIITETTWHFMTRFDYIEVGKFFRSVSVGSGGQAVEQSLEKIRANIYWKENIEQIVIQWLTQFND